MSTTIYTGKCVRCGHLTHQDHPIGDGSRMGHSVHYYGHDGLTATEPCDGVFVSVMGRTTAEVRGAVATHTESRP